MRNCYCVYLIIKRKGHFHEDPFLLHSQEAQKDFLENQDHLVSWTSSEWTKLETEVFQE